MKSDMNDIEERAESFWNAVRSSIYSSKDKIVDWGKRCYMAGASEQKSIDIEKACSILAERFHFDSLDIDEFRLRMEDDNGMDSLQR